MSIKIDDGVQMPKKQHGRPSKYPMNDLEIGQSFFVPNKTCMSFAGYRPRYKPKKFTVRSVIENGTKGIRVWRIE